MSALESNIPASDEADLRDEQSPSSTSRPKHLQTTGPAVVGVEELPLVVTKTKSATDVVTEPETVPELEILPRHEAEALHPEVTELMETLS